VADKEWVTIQPNLDPILEPINEVVEQIDSVLSFLIAVLNIVQAILSIIKVFLVGLLDPIRAIVEAIITLIRNIVNDLRQMGVYMTSDKNLFQAPFEDLVGGYDAYERRMLARLLDSTDPNRPNFSTSSAVLALFAYRSAEDAVFLLKLIFKIIAFFGDNSPANTRIYPTPTTPSILFGPQGTLNFRNLSKSLSAETVPDSISINWQQPTNGKLFTPAPKGFLIHVSTLPDGFNVLVKRPKSEQSSEVEDISSDFLVGIDPTTGGPLKLYGGVCDLGTGERAQDFSRLETTDEHGVKLLLTVGQNTPPFKPSLLTAEENDGKPVGGATYFVKAGFFAKMGANQSFNAFLSKDQLPMGIEVTASPDGSSVVTTFDTNKYFVRVTALSKEYVQGIGIDSAPPAAPVPIGKNNLHLYNFNYDNILSQKSGRAIFPDPPGLEISFEEFTSPSSPAQVAFPSASMKDYITAVQSAVIVAILCRIDFAEQPTNDEGNAYWAFNTHLKGRPTGLEGSRAMYPRFGINPKKFYSTDDAVSFRRKLLVVVQRVSQILLDTTPSNELMDLVYESADKLVNFKWNQVKPEYPEQTILESLSSKDPNSGIASNPAGCGIRSGSLFMQGPSRDGVYDTTPGSSEFIWMFGQGSGDWSPVVYSKTSPALFSEIDFVRKSLLEYDDGSVLLAAKAVLQIAGARLSRPEGDSQWITKRFFEEALAPLDDVLVNVERILLGILDGLQGLIDKIVAYIEAIQARIFQLQALIEKIRALLKSLQFFDLPSFSGLLLVENGTNGVINGLIASENKPEDSRLTYGAGALFIFGGLSDILLEILVLALSGGED